MVRSFSSRADSTLTVSFFSLPTSSTNSSSSVRCVRGEDGREVRRAEATGRGAKFFAASGFFAGRPRFSHAPFTHAPIESSPTNSSSLGSVSAAAMVRGVCARCACKKKTQRAVVRVEKRNRRLNAGTVGVLFCKPCFSGGWRRVHRLWPSLSRAPTPPCACSGKQARTPSNAPDRRAAPCRPSARLGAQTHAAAAPAASRLVWPGRRRRVGDGDGGGGERVGGAGARCEAAFF